MWPRCCSRFNSVILSQVKLVHSGPKIPKIGIDLINDSHFNKELAFSINERQILGIHGLLPAKISTPKDQMEMIELKIQEQESDMQRYNLLREVHAFNKRIYYRLLKENMHKYLRIIHLPTITEVCLHMQRVFKYGSGLFITIHDRGNIYEVLRNWSSVEIKAICVSNGGDVLGLGDMGVNGFAICLTQVDLYTAIAGVNPSHCLAIAIDVGTNNEALWKDPSYLGLRHNRITGKVNEELMEEFFKACTKLYGSTVLFHLQDFHVEEARSLSKKFRNRYCIFNSGDQPTPATVLMGLMSARKLCKKRLHEHTYFIYGAGVTGMGIANLLVSAMIQHGFKVQEACEKIWLFDSKGLITKGRIKNIKNEQLTFAKDFKDGATLVEAIEEVKPSCLIGVSTVGGSFTKEVLEAMAKVNDRPIVFAMSCPASNMECTAIDAYTHTQGRVLYANGHTTAPITYNNKTYRVSTITNIYIVPGIVLGITVGSVKYMSDDIFMIAAKTASKFVTNDNLKEGLMYPEFGKIYDISLEIAVKILEHGFEKGICTLFPRPKDLRSYVKKEQYMFNYWDFTPKTWKW